MPIPGLGGGSRIAVTQETAGGGHEQEFNDVDLVFMNGTCV